MKQSLFKEFINASQYTDYDKFSEGPEVPIKSQLQSLLSNLPDEEQLEAFEGDVRTLKTSIRAIKFESPSVVANVDKIASDVLVVRDKLRSIITGIEQLLRNLSIKNPKHKGEDNPIPEIEQSSIEGIGIRETVNIYKNALRNINKEELKYGVKHEMLFTDNWNDAYRVASEHLIEDASYYKKLKNALMYLG